MGEVSIYAAWTMKHKLHTKPKIGNKDQKGDWKIVLYQISAPDTNARHCGWQTSDYALKYQVQIVGIKFYKGKGRCLNGC